MYNAYGDQTRTINNTGIDPRDPRYVHFDIDEEDEQDDEPRGRRALTPWERWELEDAYGAAM